MRNVQSQHSVDVMIVCCVVGLFCGCVGTVAAPASTDGGTLNDAGGPTDSGSPSDAGSTDGGIVVLRGTLTGDIRIDNFGWHPSDAKTAVLLGNAGATVQLLSAADNSLAASYSASAAQTDSKYSGDTYATVDFSTFTETGDFYFYLPSLDQRSYVFRIAPDVYNVVGAAAVKAYYFQRCNHDKVLPYATDLLLGFPGAGGQWEDGACHSGDFTAPAGPASVDNGPLDVHGGWHDAGDYQKTLWGRGVPEMLFAYEVNPSVWSDGQLNIPESGNGIPDILDEVRWELDFYVRMQRPDGHFMTSAKGHNPTVTSPPSASDEQRVYFDCTSPQNNGWSGGGVTIAQATGNAVLSLAHAAIVFRSIGQTSIGDGYATAATAGWTWLNGQALTGTENRIKAAAASAMFRMTSSLTTAQTFADAFAWDTWDGMIPGGSVTPGESPISTGAWHYLMNASGTSTVKAKIQTAVAQALVDPAFTVDGPYGGMFGDTTNGWDWSWGSNRTQSLYGANLLMASTLGINGSHTAAEVASLAQKHFHYLVGLNPLNMVYLTNMEAYGGEHSSFQIFHSWFSFTGNDGDNGNTTYNGKPQSVLDPLYPYYSPDSAVSTHGPAPGFMPGGPNWYYDCSATIPDQTFPARAYRDFSVGCGWNGSICTACSWEMTEPDVGYQGPFVLLASFMMSG